MGPCRIRSPMFFFSVVCGVECTRYYVGLQFSCLLSRWVLLVRFAELRITTGYRADGVPFMWLTGGVYPPPAMPPWRMRG